MVWGAAISWRPFCLLVSVNRVRIKGSFVIHEIEIDRVVLWKAHRTVKAGSTTGVTSAGSLLGDIENESILITVRADFVDFLGVSGSRSLVPNLLAGPRIINRFTLFDGHLQRVLVHVGQHERLACLVINGHGRDEAVVIEPGCKGEGFVEFLFIGAGENFSSLMGPQVCHHHRDGPDNTLLHFRRRGS